MSIRSRITARLAAIGDGFDRYFAPWAADVQRANAHRAEAERIQAEQDETYAQAMARLTGADPVAFEPEPGRTEAEAEAALQAGEEEFADYWSGEGQDARRDLDPEDSDPDWVDPEADLMYGDTFYWTQPTSAGHAATREQQGDWATLPGDLQAQYLGDRAAELTEMDEFDAYGRAGVIARMACDGLSGDQVAQVVETARAGRDNEATAEAADAEVRHTAEELSKERGELIWPDQVARAQDRARAEVARQADAEREAAEWRDRNAEADPYANRDLRGEAEADGDPGHAFMGAPVPDAQVPFIPAEWIVDAREMTDAQVDADNAAGRAQYWAEIEGGADGIEAGQ